MPGILAYTFLDRDGNVLSTDHGQTLVMPASNMKVVSGFSAYKLLGSDFRFKTDFSLDRNKLTVTGDPTPLLDGRRLEEIGTKVASTGNKINEIVLDTSSLDDNYYGPGWMIEDSRYTYQAKIAALTINEGCIPKGHQPNAYGNLKGAHDEGLRPVRNPERLFAESLWAAIGNRGETKFHVSASDTSEPIIDYQYPLTEVLKHVEEYSCNFSIEVLTKYLSRHANNKKGSWKGGTNEIYKVLREMKLDVDEVRIVDGSGLSRLNLLTTDFLASLVFRISKSKDNGFLNLLPSPGEGTLRNRLKDLAEYGIQAKTGSISYCSSLTGYVEKLGVSFSIAINHSIESDGLLPEKVDNLLRSELKKLRIN